MSQARVTAHSSLQAESQAIPKQPESLSEDVVSLLNDMHREPQNATELLARWRKLHGDRESFTSALFRGLNLRGAQFQRLDLSSVRFESCDLDRANFKGGCKLRFAEFRSVNASGAEFARADCRNATFADSNLSHAKFDDSRLSQSLFVRCDLSHTTLKRASLDGAHFSSVQFTNATAFNHPQDISGCSIDRYALACLGGPRGGLTEGNLMDMEIVDHVAELRLRFSGFWSYFHILSMAAFFFPYVWFVVEQWGRARFMAGNSGDSITLLEALGRFIWNGGANWQQGWQLDGWALIRFVTVLAYQAARLVLLAKTKQLEMQQFVTGLPAKFSLDAPIAGHGIPWLGSHLPAFRWRWLVRIVDWGIWITALLAFLNTWHFLGMRVPVNSP